MPIDTMDKLIAAMPGQHRPLHKAAAGAEGGGTWHSVWRVAGMPGAGAVPPTGNGVVPTRLTPGAIAMANPGGVNKLYLARFAISSTAVSTVILYDRLWHNSGFVGNVITAQTIATPPTITRPNANGEGVELWMEVYTAMGATASVFTVTYTNQDGVAGRTSSYSMPANALAVGQMVPFMLDAGDTGVRTVTQVQLSASTGTAGDFGLVLLRRVAELPITLVNTGVDRDAFALGMPEIFPDACLALQMLCSTTSSGNIMGAVAFIEG